MGIDEVDLIYFRSMGVFCVVVQSILLNNECDLASRTVGMYGITQLNRNCWRWEESLISSLAADRSNVEQCVQCNNICLLFLLFLFLFFIDFLKLVNLVDSLTLSFCRLSIKCCSFCSAHKINKNIYSKL